MLFKNKIFKFLLFNIFYRKPINLLHVYAIYWKNLNPSERRKYNERDYEYIPFQRNLNKTMK